MTTPAVLAVPGLEDILQGLDRLYGYARNGNATAKRRAALGLNAVGIRAATVSQALGRSMSEPDAHYGPECTEPLAAAATHFRVGASSAADSEAAIASIIAAMRDMEGRQVPHYNELQETGGR